MELEEKLATLEDEKAREIENCKKQAKQQISDVEKEMISMEEDHIAKMHNLKKKFAEIVLCFESMYNHINLMGKLIRKDYV